jgi:hypothetical protein
MPAATPPLAVAAKADRPVTIERQIPVSCEKIVALRLKPAARTGQTSVRPTRQDAS